MSTLYIRLPSKVVAESQQAALPLYCPFAVVSDGGLIEREGVTALSELSEFMRRAQRVVLILAASDVTLLHVKLPPLSAARMKAALPNLVEDQLMSDPAECIVVAGGVSDGLRTVAVVHRGWLETISKTLITMGARRLSVVPAQLCLPCQGGRVCAAVAEQGMDVEVTVRLTEQNGIGLTVFAEQPELAPVEAIEALCAVVPNALMTLYVPPSRMRNYQETLTVAPALAERIVLSPDNWSRWIDGADNASIDLMPGSLGRGGASMMDWHSWRWPLALSTGVLLVNTIGLNIDWLRLKREADTLHTTMMQTYKSVYPKETAIVDPLAQMRNKLLAARRVSGQLAPDDFVPLVAAFSEAWTNAGQGAQAIAGVEYRDQSLLLKMKADVTAPMEQVKAVLAARNLSLSEAKAGVWQLRSMK